MKLAWLFLQTLPKTWVNLADIFWRYFWFDALFGPNNLKFVLLTTSKTFVAFATLEYENYI